MLVNILMALSGTWLSLQLGIGFPAVWASQGSLGD